MGRTKFHFPKLNLNNSFKHTKYSGREVPDAYFI